MSASSLWTIADWQQAYRTQGQSLEQLLTWHANLAPKDPAWIQLVSSEQLTLQLEQIAARLVELGGDWSRLPLYGIPFAVKDNIDVEGLPTTAACPMLQPPASVDAHVVQKLKALGAVVIGKTNLDQFATGLVGTRSPYGIVPNPFHPAYISGGSSSGSASVVSRGIVPFALGTDTAGSGRVPAALQNIVGLKPTRGWFSNTGLLPACKTLDCISVFALTVADAWLIAELMGGSDPLDPYSRVHPRTTPAAFSATPKIGVPNRLFFTDDPIQAAAFAVAQQQWAELGATIIPIDFEPFERLAKQLYQGAWVAERTAAVGELLSDPDSAHPVVKSIIDKGRSFSAVDAYNAEYQRAELSQQIAQTFAAVDCVLVPTTPTIYTIQALLEQPIELNSVLGTYTNFTNLADLSALAIPAPKRSDGLPFGVTLIAPAWYDRALAELAQRMQNQVGWILGTSNRPTPTQQLPISPNHVRVAVVGAHLTGMPLNFQLTTRQAVLVEQTLTAPHYALYALAGTVPPKPGLARCAEGEQGHHLIVEVWDIPTARFGEFVAEIPPPLGIGNVELIDGRWVKGFICEPYALASAQPISEFGGWRAYIAHRNAQAAAAKTTN